MSGTEAENAYVAVTLQVLWYISYPFAFIIYYLFVGIISLAHALYQPIGFLIQPLVYLVHFLLVCAAAPFHLLARFETVYIYLGVAAIVGVTGGLFLSGVYSLLRNIIGLDAPDEMVYGPSSAREYREAKLKSASKASKPLMTSGVLDQTSTLDNRASASDYGSPSDGARRGQRGKSLWSQTIMEEMDSDF